MMSDLHVCEVCYQTKHVERCELGCWHWPPLCCRGCPCGSFESAVHDPPATESLTVGALIEKLQKLPPGSFVLLEVGGDGAVHGGSARTVTYETENGVVYISAER